MGTLRSKRMWVALGVGALCLVTASLAYAEETKDDIEAELNRRIALWGEDLRKNDPLALASITPRNEYYDAIVDLGLPAVPYLIEKMKQGRLVFTEFVHEITGKRFTVYEEGFPEGARACTKAMIEWWSNAREETPKRFEQLYSERKKLLDQGKDEEAKKKEIQIRCLGLAALPLIMEKAREGDTTLHPIVEGITNGKTKDMSQPQLATWWEKNQGQLRIPFPNARPIAKAGADRTVTAGQVIVLDGSASTDADGDVLTYQWRQTAGPVAGLSNAQAAQPTFTAPAVEQRTTLVFELIVNDAGDLTQTVPTPNSKSEPAQVTITIEPK